MLLARRGGFDVSQPMGGGALIFWGSKPRKGQLMRLYTTTAGVSLSLSLSLTSRLPGKLCFPTWAFSTGISTGDGVIIHLVSYQLG